MTAYIVIFFLCGVILIQSIIYYRERLKLYDLLKAEKEKTPYNIRDKPRNDYKKHGTGHKRALRKWRNGGDSE